MPERSPNLDMPYLQPSQAQKHVTHNEALQSLDALVQFSVIALGATTPPGSPASGECWGLGTGASGAWAGHDGEIAVFVDSGWVYLVPREGWRVWDQANGAMMIFRGADWAAPGFSRLGINATPDVTNRLSVASDAILLSHDGDDHRLKINKASAADTGSVLFQTGFTGHAELGLAGSDNWSIKVSSDGSSWTNAISVDNTNGNVGIGAGSADAALHVQRDDGTASLKIEEVSTSTSARTVATFINNGRPDFVLANSSTGLEWSFGGGTNLVFKSGTLGSDPSSKTTQATLKGANGNLALAGAVEVGGYTVATLPTASAMQWAIIGVSDETGGAVLAFSDGTNWRRVTDRTIVS